MTRLLPALLAVSYPLLAHAAAWSGRAEIALFAGLVLALIALWPGLAARRPLPWVLLAIAVAALLELARFDLATLPLFAPPVLLNAFLAWVFGRTLAPGRRPLIETMVWVLRDRPAQIDPAIQRYARRLTGLWAGLLGALALTNLILALCAAPDGLLLSAGIAPPIAVPLAAWSLFANVLNYLIVAAFFVIEFALRKRYFPDQPYRNLLDFTVRVARLGPAFWRGLVR